VEEAERFPSAPLGDYVATPIFATPGYQNTFAAVFNRSYLEASFPEYFPPESSSIRGSIGEAVRNVGQHGVSNDPRFHRAGYGECLFASAALFVRELALRSQEGRAHRILVALVTDEGPGVHDPERSMVDGVGNGEDYEGMGVELGGSLLYLIKARHGEWSLFKGAQEQERDKDCEGSWSACRNLSDDERVSRVCAVDLPASEKGCQKILVFAHPSVPMSEMRDLKERLMGVLQQET
jgi:hypothetical protein